MRYMLIKASLYVGQIDSCGNTRVSTCEQGWSPKLFGVQKNLPSTSFLTGLLAPMLQTSSAKLVQLIQRLQMPMLEEVKLLGHVWHDPEEQSHDIESEVTASGSNTDEEMNEVGITYLDIRSSTRHS